MWREVEREEEEGKDGGGCEGGWGNGIGGEDMRGGAGSDTAVRS